MSQWADEYADLSVLSFDFNFDRCAGQALRQHTYGLHDCYHAFAIRHDSEIVTAGRASQRTALAVAILALRFCGNLVLCRLRLLADLHLIVRLGEGV